GARSITAALRRSSVSHSPPQFSSVAAELDGAEHSLRKYSAVSRDGVRWCEMRSGRARVYLPPFQSGRRAGVGGAPAAWNLERQLVGSNLILFHGRIGGMAGGGAQRAGGCLDAFGDRCWNTLVVGSPDTIAGQREVDASEIAL